MNRFEAVLSPTQLSTLLELIYDCGSARIRTADTDRLVIFNGQLENMNYNFSKAVLTTGHHRASMENKSAEIKNYKLLDLKELDADKWKLTGNYTDFIKKEYRK